MSFTSVDFVILVLITLAGYYRVQKREYQIYILIISSFVFYSFYNIYLTGLLLFVSIITAYASYVSIQRKFKQQKTLSIIAIIILIAILGYFKYKDQLILPYESIFTVHEKILSSFILLPLPIGISFYTFQAISLLIESFKNPNDIYDDKQVQDFSLFKHCKNAILYVSFFPQLISGPITKAYDFFPQIRKKNFRDVDFLEVTKLLISGYFLKLFVADNLAQLTIAIHNQYQWSRRGSDELLTMLFGYSAQIFADFAGYSLIAIGVARLFGYKLMDNFNFPYIATSFSDFWKRWHVSLSTWIRDYIYFPLGGNRKGSIRTYFNIILAMFICGLWHGSSLKFAAWGLIHGFALAIERIIKLSGKKNIQIYEADGMGNIFKNSKPLLVLLKWIIVYTVVSVGWLFFSLDSISDVLKYLSMILEWKRLTMPTTLGHRITTSFLISIIMGYHLIWGTKIYRHPIIQSNEAYIFGFMLFLIMCGSGPKSAFIYFQF